MRTTIVIASVQEGREQLVKKLSLNMEATEALLKIEEAFRDSLNRDEDAAAKPDHAAKPKASKHVKHKDDEQE